MMELIKRYRLQSAHRLPNAGSGDPEGRLHGHCFLVEITVRGKVDAHTGWVIDFAEITAAFQPAFEALDHRLLNDVEGLEDPTAENIARWIFGRIKDALPLLWRVDVIETETRRGSHGAAAHFEETPST